MKLFLWTPKGYDPVEQSPETYRLEVINEIQDMVRDTAYHLASVELTDKVSEAYSRSCMLYNNAVRDLVKFAGPDYAREFVAKTYNPQFKVTIEDVRKLARQPILPSTDDSR